MSEEKKGGQELIRLVSNNGVFARKGRTFLKNDPGTGRPINHKVDSETAAKLVDKPNAPFRRVGSDGNVIPNEDDIAKAERAEAERAARTTKKNSKKFTKATAGQKAVPNEPETPEVEDGEGAGEGGDDTQSGEQSEAGSGEDQGGAPASDDLPPGKGDLTLDDITKPKTTKSTKSEVLGKGPGKPAVKGGLKVNVVKKVAPAADPTTEGAKEA